MSADPRLVAILRNEILRSVAVVNRRAPNAIERDQADVGAHKLAEAVALADEVAPGITPSPYVYSPDHADVFSAFPGDDS